MGTAFPVFLEMNILLGKMKPKINIFEGNANFVNISQYSFKAPENSLHFGITPV